MKRFLLIFGLITLVATTTFAAKYSVNTNGVVKTNGQTVAPAIQQTGNLFNVYNSSNYISSAGVNKDGIKVIDIVMDYSGSMKNWIDEAKRAMSSIVAQIPATTRVGFRVFGHDFDGTNLSNSAVLAHVKNIVKENGRYKVKTTSPYLGCSTGYCTATKQVCPMMPININALLYGMNSVGVGGATPLVYALDKAVTEDFGSIPQSIPKKIVLITDGGENCGGDACLFAQQLSSVRSDIHVDVILVSGFYNSKLACLANRTGGTLYRVNNLSDFSTVLTKSMKTVPTKVKQEQAYEYVK